MPKQLGFRALTPTPFPPFPTPPSLHTLSQAEELKQWLATTTAPWNKHSSRLLRMERDEMLKQQQEEQEAGGADRK